MKPGQAVEKLTHFQVIRVMRRASGLNLSELAEAMGRNMRTVGCWFGDGSPDKFIPVPLVPLFCHVLRSPMLIEWQMAQFERLQRGEAANEERGEPHRVVDLILRGIVEAVRALDLLRDVKGPLSPSQGRQEAEALLLAVSTLAAAASEARRAAPEPARHLSFLSQDAAEALRLAARPSWWRRFFGWLGACFRSGRVAEELDQARQDLAEASLLLRVLGAELGQCLVWMNDEDRLETTRLLEEAGRFEARICRTSPDC